MKKTLYLKFLLAYVIFGIFSFVIVSTFVENLIYGHLTKESASTLYEEASLIAENYASELYQNENDLVTVKKQLDTLAGYLNCAVRIINPSGRIILDTTLPLDVESVLQIDGFDPTSFGDSYYTVSTFFHDFETPHLNVLVPITSQFKTHGYVALHYQTDHIQRACDSMMNIAFIMLGILLLLSLIILIFFTELVYVPLKKITRAAEHYADGNMHYEFQVETEDEMGYLAACMRYMAGQISGFEDDQKKLVANISHDFRSPLTSIRGYLEAMQDGTIPPEMHEKYLGIVLNETERLTKLTNSLLTLNNLNTKGMLLDRTDFDINTVIRNTASSFEGRCREKNIHIELVLTGEELLVNADTEKIQRVLYNLTDNAIKFSHPDSSIKIETYIKKNHLFVSVKDAGIGIPKDDLKMIWNRFYKSDVSRGKDKKGTGLGLSIVKEIINSHQENINVVSTEGVGTEFIFSLPLSEDMEEED